MKGNSFGHGVSLNTDYNDAYYSFNVYSMADMVRQTQFLFMFYFVLHYLILVMYPCSGGLKVPIFL